MSEKLFKPFKTDVGRILEFDTAVQDVGFENPTYSYSPKGRLKLKTPFHLNAADVAWALPANKTKDVGRIQPADVGQILESDTAVQDVGFKNPTYSLKVV